MYWKAVPSVRVWPLAMPITRIRRTDFTSAVRLGIEVWQSWSAFGPPRRISIRNFGAFGSDSVPATTARHERIG